MSLLSELETKIKATLAPIVGTTADDVLQISTMPFFAGDDLGQLLEITRDRMPGAFLSIPVASYDAANDKRICTMSLTYQLLIGNTTRRTVDTRKAYAYTMHDEVWRCLYYAATSGVSAANIDFIRPASWQYMDVTGEKDMAALFFTFNVGVRQWLVN